MNNSDSKEKTLNNWLLSGDRILGDIEDKGAIRSSPIMARDGNRITTYSGSIYVLETPHPFMANRETLEIHWGFSTWEEAVDNTIKENRYIYKNDNPT